jgi:Protein of unknown function (DUF2934)
MSDNPKPATKRGSTRKPKAKPPRPDHEEIAERAYFIHLQEGDCDELTNWLRAECELRTV